MSLLCPTIGLSGPLEPHGKVSFLKCVTHLPIGYVRNADFLVGKKKSLAIQGMPGKSPDVVYIMGIVLATSM